MCPRYEAIHEIIGHKANVSPHSILDTAREKRDSISEGNSMEYEAVIDPSLTAEYHYQGVLRNDHHEELDLTWSPERLTTLLENGSDLAGQQNEALIQPELNMNEPSPEAEDNHGSPPQHFNFPSPSPDLLDLEGQIQGDLGSPSPTPEPPRSISPIEQAPQSIRKAAKMVNKRKSGTDPIGSRPMKPLPSVNPNPGRNKAPGASLVKDRDDNRFQYFDRKMEEKKKNDVDLKESQARIAQEALNWEKEKYENQRSEASRAESSKNQIQSDIVDKNIQWEREKFNQENVRFIKSEEARFETKRINTRREVMQACQIKGMSVQEMKDYMELLFAK